MPWLFAGRHRNDDEPIEGLSQGKSAEKENAAHLSQVRGIGTATTRLVRWILRSFLPGQAL